MRRPTLVSVFAVRVSPRPWAHSSKMRRTTLPIVAILSFVCSIGNVPLAAVLWNGGISFGGVISFIFADLIVLPILNIYRKYYGGRMTWFLLWTSYVAMAIAGLAVELIFLALGLVPSTRQAIVMEPHLTLNYTAVLNVVFLACVCSWSGSCVRAGRACCE